MEGIMHCYSRHFYRNWGGFRAKQALMHLASGSFQLDDFQFVLILEWGAIFMASRFLVCKAAKYSLQGTTQGRYLTGGVPPVRFSM